MLQTMLLYIMIVSEEDEMNGNKTQTMLMDKLRSRHTAQHRSWTDCVMKSIRSSFVSVQTDCYFLVWLSPLFRWVQVVYV